MSDRIDTEAMWGQYATTPAHPLVVLALCDEVDRLREALTDIEARANAWGECSTCAAIERDAKAALRARAALGIEPEPKVTYDEWLASLSPEERARVLGEQEAPTEPPWISAMKGNTHPQVAPEPERCPTCRSPNPSIRDYVGQRTTTKRPVSKRCSNPWHRATDTEGDE